jgi:hypothetical protein
MTIELRPGPSDGEQVVRRALSFLSDHDPSDPLGGAPATKLSAAIPVYRMDLNTIQNENFINFARSVGWRYLVGLPEKSQAIAVADVREDEAGKTTFSRLVRGMIAKSLQNATILARKEYGDKPERFEFRIIDIPALHRSALWFHGDHDHDIFFSIYSRKVDDTKVREEPSFVKDVVGAASHYRVKCTPF